MKAPLSPADPSVASTAVSLTLLLFCASPICQVRCEEGDAPRFDLKAVASAAMRDPGTVPESANPILEEVPKGELPEAGDSGEMFDSAGTPASEAPGTAPPGIEASEKSEAGIEFVERSNFILSRILENRRFLDPFGMSMDPSNTRELPMVAEGIDDSEEAAPLNISSLKAALQKLPVTGVYPQRQLVVVGARSFSPGDHLGLRTEGLTLRLRYEGIREYSIFFRDMETNEVTSVEFNTRPAEFEPIRPGSQREPGEGIHAMSGLFIVN